MKPCSMWLNFLDLLSLQDLGSLTPRHIGSHKFLVSVIPWDFSKLCWLLCLLTEVMKPLDQSQGQILLITATSTVSQHSFLDLVLQPLSLRGGLEEGQLTPAHTHGCAIPWLNSWHLVSLQELPERRNDQQDICAPLCGSNQCLWFWLLKLLMP